jgi:hypothetical protein
MTRVRLICENFKQEFESDFLELDTEIFQLTDSFSQSQLKINRKYFDFIEATCANLPNNDLENSHLVCE